MQPDRLGPYRIERKLGRGGMGSVYVGVDERGERAALKVLSPALAAEPGFRQRFDAEIESLKKLTHPGIVRLYGFGEHDDYVFYAMEFVDGPSLEEELRAGRRYTWRETAALAIQIARALRHAHDSGVIHRDIKPANLLLADEETIKVSDFGIARLFGHRLTGSGGVMGTAEYMAPEQADAQPVTPRCDLYSLGCVMYAMLTGGPPFRAESMPALLEKHRREAPRGVREFAPDTPLEMERIVARLLEKSPDARFPTAQSLARELEGMQDRLTLGTSRILPETPAATASPLAHSPVEIPAAEGASPREPRPLHATGETGPPPTERSAPTVRFEAVNGPKTHAARGSRWQILFAALPTALILAAVVGLIVHFARGPSAEERMANIEEAATAEDPAALVDRERDVFDLLDELPADDPRVEKLQEYVSLIALARLQRKLTRTTAEPSPGRTPIERLLEEAIRLAAVDPERAATQLETLIAAYDRPEAGAAERQAVQIARRQLKQLRPQIEQQRLDHRSVIIEASARAVRLDTTEPAAARRIREALVRQYGGEPWAADLVALLRQVLDAS